MSAQIFVKPRTRFDARDNGLVITAMSVPIAARKCLVEVINPANRFVDLAICHVMPRHVLAVPLIEVATQLAQFRHHCGMAFHQFPRRCVRLASYACTARTPARPAPEAFCLSVSTNT